MLSVTRVSYSPRERAWDGALTARINAIYYELLIAHLTRWDRGLRIASMLMSSAGIAAAIKACNSEPLVIGVGILAAAITASTFVLGLQEHARRASAILPEYVAHSQKLRRLYEQGDEVDSGHLDLALDDLDRTMVVEAEKIGHSVRKLLERAQDMLHQEIGAEPAAKNRKKVVLPPVPSAGDRPATSSS